MKIFWFALLLLFPMAVFAQFNRNLYLGMQNNLEVVKMQDFLRAQGFFVYPFSTGTFSSLTFQAVKKFQQANGIFPPNGYFGPKTRTVANKLYAVKSPVAPRVLQGKPAQPQTSAYKGKVQMSVSGTSSEPNSESVTIYNVSEKDKISITGWIIENSNGERFVIPKGHDLPGFSAFAQDPILLRPGDRAYVNAGAQGKQMDFRTNLCVGYFSEFSDFNPAVYSSCPRPDTSKLLHLKDICISLIESTPSCRMPKTANTFIDSTCSEYLSANLNYVGCVENYRSRNDFFSNEWRIWMQRKGEFMRNTHDKIILKDPQERVAAEYSY